MPIVEDDQAPVLSAADRDAYDRAFSGETWTDFSLPSAKRASFVSILVPSDRGQELEEVSFTETTSATRGYFPRVWIKIKNSLKLTLRVLGLPILASFSFRGKPGARREEDVKIAIRRNRTMALLHSLIHVIPVGVAMWEIIFNWNTYYAGSIIYNQVYYQFAAKAHEVAIQASLAAIVFSYVRHEMALGQGLPFGALFSGLQVSQISYLWSMEFWGSLTSGYLPIRRRLGLLMIILLSFLLAAASGPSSAILLIPRLDYWPAGSTDIWVNMTVGDIWPTQLSGASVPDDCSISQEATISTECPSSEWQSIGLYKALANRAFDWLPGLGELIPPVAVQLTGKNSLREVKITDWKVPNPLLLGNSSADSEADHQDFSLDGFGASTQQAMVADALVSTGATWDLATNTAHLPGGHGVALSDQQGATHSIHSGYYQPYSLAYCVPDVVNGSDDTRPVAFPISLGLDYSDPSTLQYVNASLYHSSPAIEYPSILRKDLLKLQGSKSNNLVRWVELPPSVFNGTTMGVIILLPRNETNWHLAPSALSQDYVVCNIAAGWGSSSINTTSYQQATSTTTSLINLQQAYTSQEYQQQKAQADDQAVDNPVNYYQQITDRDYWFDYPIYPTLPVTMDEAWAQYLNPFVPSLNTTVIDILMKADIGDNDPQTTAMVILSGLVANGMARIGFNGLLQGNVTIATASDGEEEFDGTLWLENKGNFFTVDPTLSKDWAKFRVDSTLKGYAYNTHGVSPKVAIAFLFTYCVFALGHLLYAGISGISSTAWDSIAEVTALAMNSTPSTTLRNTCAGISELHVFKTPVRILARRDANGDEEHLELVFGADGEKEGRGVIRANRKYGTMPRWGKESKLA